MNEAQSTAIVAISRPGSRLAIRLRDGFPGAKLFLPKRHSSLTEEGADLFDGPLAAVIRQLFTEYRGLVVFGSVGMAVRLVAPLLQNKRTDPAVVVVDDSGRFAVSLLSGHIGGANVLARRVAELLGALPVITTASDVLGLPAVDLLGRELGWLIEEGSAVTRVSGAIVDGEPVGLLQEAGEPTWWPEGVAVPPNLVRFDTLEEMARANCAGALIVTDRILTGWEERLPPCVIYRPKNLVAGVGCNRGSSAEEISLALKAALQVNGLAVASLGKLASVDLKGDEAGLLACALEMGLSMDFFSPQELNSVPNLPNPSEIVRGWVGTGGVCEPAALLASGAQGLLVPKVKTANVTVAIARVDYSAKVEGL